MKILLTGGSSFTGYWFAKELGRAGHEVVAVFRRPAEEYSVPLRRSRVDALTKISCPVFGISFGDDAFLQLVKDSNWDLLAHHAAEVTDYKSPDFDVTAAVEKNTLRLPFVLDLLSRAGCSKIVLTGSVFEQDEGTGSKPLEAFSPYGLSKGLTWQMFRYHTKHRGMNLGKFVIPNPFGPYEEPRFTHYLMKNWFEAKTPAVNTPAYVRDNIHVSLLAKAYVHFASTLAEGISRMNPSGYIESQGSFAHRLANEMNKRLGIKCELELKTQSDFSEPRIRINTDVCDTEALKWDEKGAWDELAEYYSQLMNQARNRPIVKSSLGRHRGPFIGAAPDIQIAAKEIKVRGLSSAISTTCCSAH